MRPLLTWALLCASLLMAAMLVREWLAPAPLPLLVDAQFSPCRPAPPPPRGIPVLPSDKRRIV